MNIKHHIENLIAQIKQQPMNFDLRLALIQYYCIEGNWDKAAKTLEQYLKMNEKDEQTKILLKFNIICEQKRLSTLNGVEQALFYPNSDAKIAQHQQDLFAAYLKNTDAGDLKEIFLNSFDDYVNEHQVALNNADQLNGLWIDTDLRYSFVIELFVQDQYYWLPISDIASLTFKDNQYLTDILWRRADIQLKDGRSLSAFVPSRYPLLATDELDDALKLNKQTKWMDWCDLSIAQGQKTWTNGTDEVGLLDIQSFKQT